ncbi:GGDEF domain-containing protein, partial [Acinetobacter baumannii]
VSAIRDISDRKTMEMHLAHAATTDGLTGLGNRRAFDALLDRRLTDCAAGLGGGCIAIFDIDFFKRVNDQHGHAAGDRVLESFAAI